jgi:hypothetical protein
MCKESSTASETLRCRILLFDSASVAHVRLHTSIKLHYGIIPFPRQKTDLLANQMDRSRIQFCCLDVKLDHLFRL